MPKGDKKKFFFKELKVRRKNAQRKKIKTIKTKMPKGVKKVPKSL